MISDCSDELREFVDKVDAPVCDTLMGKGAFNGTDERYTGMLECMEPRLPILESANAIF